MSAKDPDRNLRFMLGHAFLLDKALYRVAHIEEDFDDHEDEEHENLRPQVATVLRGDDEKGTDSSSTVDGQSGGLDGGRVDFKSEGEADVKHQERQSSTADAKRQTGLQDGQLTPPDEEFDNLDLDADDDENGLGLTRFASAAGRPPRLISDEGKEDDEDPDEAVSPPALPADLDVGTVIAGPESEDVSDLYERVRGCPCHGLGDKTVKGTKFWEIPENSAAGEGGKTGKRMAIMQVEA